MAQTKYNIARHNGKMVEYLSKGGKFLPEQKDALLFAMLPAKHIEMFFNCGETGVFPVEAKQEFVTYP